MVALRGGRAGTVGARVVVPVAASVGVVALFLPWVAFSSRFGDLVVAPPATGWALREWGIAVVLAAAVALWRAARHAPERLVAAGTLAFGAIVVVETVAAAARVHGGPLLLPDAGMSVGFYLELVAGLAMVVDGAWSLVAPPT